jgi:tetratricopeptide (TPR) repeat protein
LKYKWSFLVFFLVLAICNPVIADFELNLNKGVAAYLKKDYQGAVKFLEQAVAENPNSATANHILGLSLLRLGKYKESIPYLEKAKSLDPKIKRIYIDLGIAYLKIEYYNKALVEFTEATEQQPDNGTAYYYLGYTQYKLGNYEDAIVSFNKAYKLNPDLTLQARYYAGLSHYKMSNYEKAKEEFAFVGEFGAGTDTAVAALQYLDIIASLTKRYYGGVSAGFQYDTNVAVEADDIDIVSDKSAPRAVFFFNIGYNPYLKPDAVIGGNYSFYMNFNKDVEDFNIQDHRINLYGAKKTTMGGTPVSFFLDFFYDITLIDGTPASHLFSQSLSVSPQVSFQWTPYTSTILSYEFRYNNFEDFPERDAVNNNFTIAELFSVYNGKLLLKPGFNFEVNSAKEVPNTFNFDYVSPEGFLEALAFFPFEITGFLEFHYYRQDYYHDDFNRVDNQFSVEVVVSKRLYKILYLDLGYAHISNFSDTDFPPPNPFEYDRDIFSVTLTARF